MPDTAEVSKTSIADIAASLLVAKAEQSPAEGSADDEDGDFEEDQSPAEGTEQSETDDQQDQVEEEGVEEDAEADEDSEEAGEAITIDDEDLIEVVVDGKVEQWTIADLKKAASGEGAIERRLQEATELRKTAHAERTTMLEKLYGQEQVIAKAVADVGETLYKPLIPAPDESMKSKNPAAYLRHKDAYDADQARIAAAKKAVEDKVAELNAQRVERLKEYGAAAAVEIQRRIPALADPKKQAPLLASMVDTAKAYGYTEQEIASALDPRMFHLMHDAMMYRGVKSGKVKERDVLKNDGQERKVPRILRSGNTKAKAMVAAKAKQADEVRKAAATSGRVSDVAAMILKPAGKKGR